VVLFWEVLEILEGGTLLEEVGHWEYVSQNKSFLLLNYFSGICHSNKKT
jgi:hypothetical protein